MSDPPRIYPSLPGSTPLFVICLSVFGSQNLPLPLRIYPLFNKFICATLPESTPLSQIIPPFSTNLHVRPSQNLPLPPRIYPPPPRFVTNVYVRPSQNVPLSPRIYPSFQQLYCYATLPESIPPFQNIPSFQQLLLKRRVYSGREGRF